MKHLNRKHNRKYFNFIDNRNQYTVFSKTPLTKNHEILVDELPN